jgi:glyoxylase-like metal-dependent hydrolase (beta-lactamase superfamily II)
VETVVHSGEGFTVSRIILGPLDTNVYLLTDDATRASAIIDAAADPDAIISLVEGSDPQAVITTHGHWDHHGAIPELTDALDIAFLLHHDDVELAGKAPDWYIEEGEISIGETSGVVLHTPGHTAGSICLALDGLVFTGDTLFPGGPGATRSPDSSFPTIIDSIQSKLMTLPDDTVVLPGHGAATTIGSERPQLPEWIERGW